jgi:hypothetical protein
VVVDDVVSATTASVEDVVAAVSVGRSVVVVVEDASTPQEVTTSASATPINACRPMNRLMVSPVLWVLRNLLGAPRMLQPHGCEPPPSIWKNSGLRPGPNDHAVENQHSNVRWNLPMDYLRRRSDLLRRQQPSERIEKQE